MSETLHGEKSPPSLEDFQDLLSSMTQDCDLDPPDIHHANEHSQVSVPEVVSTRAEGRSPSSSSSCSETSPDARSVQLQERAAYLPSIMERFGFYNAPGAVHLRSIVDRFRFHCHRSSTPSIRRGSMPISPYRLVISLMQIYKPVLRPTMMTTDFPDLGSKVMISNTPSEITPCQQTSRGRLTETRRQTQDLEKKPPPCSIRL
jgi:hypothetical protein